MTPDSAAEIPGNARDQVPKIMGKYMAMSKNSGMDRSAVIRGMDRTAAARALIHTLLKVSVATHISFMVHALVTTTVKLSVVRK